MMMNISVIIPVYNAADYIEKAADSVLQFESVKELLLIDDGSKDGSAEICEKIAANNPRVTFLQHPDKKNHGVSATRNLGINLASQEFITFLDADDYYLPNRFDMEMEYFKDPKIDGVFGAISTEFITEKGKKEYMEKFLTDGLTTVYEDAEGKDVFIGLSEMNRGFGTFFSMIALTIRKEVLDKNNLRLNEKLKIGEDKEFIIKLSYYGYLKSGLIHEPVAVRTGHEHNTITKIKNYSQNFFRHQYLLYESLYKWAIKQKDIPTEAIDLFKYKFMFSKIASKSGLAKYADFIKYAIFNPKLLKTRYRYYALKNNPKA
jgi:glycosyltransferase involved in cell wall biosynthesis